MIYTLSIAPYSPSRQFELIWRQIQKNLWLEIQIYLRKNMFEIQSVKSWQHRNIYCHDWKQIWHQNPWTRNGRQWEHEKSRCKSPFSNLRQLCCGRGPLQEDYCCLQHLPPHHRGQVGHPKACWGGAPVALILFFFFFFFFLSFFSPPF